MKKSLLLFFALLGLPALVFAAAELQSLFFDIPSDAWYRIPAFKMNSLGVIQGYPDKSFRPTQNVNRAEIAGMLFSLHNAILNPAGLGEWSEYKDRKKGFTIAHPKGTEAVAFDGGVGIRPLGGKDFFWGLLYFDKTDGKTEELISDMGKQFKNKRRERRENILLNGIQALRVIVTTTSIPNWKHEQVFIEKGTTLYVVSNGAIPNSDFELFYQSFMFIPEKIKKQLPATPTSYHLNKRVSIGQEML